MIVGLVVTEVSIGVHCLLQEFILLYCHLNLFFRQIKVRDLGIQFLPTLHHLWTPQSRKGTDGRNDRNKGVQTKNVENIHFPKSLASASLPGKYYLDV